MEEKKSYFAMIPTLILFDEELLHKPKTILLYGHISTLANKTGECWATNKYFAEVLQTSTRTVSDYISLLKNKGYIKIKTTYRKGTKQIEKRLLFPTNPMETYFHSIETGCDTPIETGCDTPIETHFQDNNTSINNTSINNKRNIKESSEQLSAGTSSDHIPYSEIIDYFNKKTGTHYRASSQKTRKLIRARFNEKFTLDDFKQVIDTKTSQWLDDPKMDKYLRPETLFGTKFENYLNEKPKKEPMSNVDWTDVW